MIDIPKRIFSAITFALLLSFSLTACRQSEWNQPDAWYRSEKQINSEYADVFYLVSTNILSERMPDGKVSYRAVNTREEKEILAREMHHLESKVFPDSLNFFAPYYHQHTMEAMDLSPEEYGKLAAEITDEVYEAFKFYLRNINHSRPVVLVGFSQGAMLITEMLKRMTPREFSHVAAAYILGWGLNEDDCKSGNIIPASGKEDTGVCISFNSVADTSAVWKAVMNNAGYSINPVNWTTGAEEASFQYAGQELSVHLDTTRKVLIVNNFTEAALPFTAIWPEGCLHFYEIQFYNSSLNSNALLRVRNFRNTEQERR